MSTNIFGIATNANFGQANTVCKGILTNIRISPNNECFQIGASLKRVMSNNFGVTWNTKLGQSRTSLKRRVSDFFNFRPHNDAFKHCAIFKGRVRNANDILSLVLRADSDPITFAGKSYNFCISIGIYLIKDIKINIYFGFFLGFFGIFLGFFLIIFCNNGINIIVVIIAESRTHS